MKLFFDLLSHVPNREVLGENRTITHITPDSRAVVPGSLFVARRGTQADGHNFISDAIGKGCAAVICEELPRDITDLTGTSFAIVENAHIALAEASHAFFDFPAQSLRMIGVTGTNGKTSCTTLLKQVLECHGETVGMIGTVGNFIGARHLPSTFTTPEAPELCGLLAEMIRANCTTVVMEVSSHSLALERVHGINFDAALFTNLTQDHLDFHGTMDAYADAKKKLFDHLRNTAIACVWGDDSYAQHMVKDCKAAVHVIATSPARWTAPHASSCTLHSVSDVSVMADGVKYALDNVVIEAPLFGAFHVANTALVWQCMRALGYEAEITTKALQSVHGAAGRMEVISLGEITGIVDYAHTPDALEKTLQSVRHVLQPGQRLLCVVGCGGDRDKTKRPLMGAIAFTLSDEVWFTSDNPRTEDPLMILEDMISGLPHSAPDGVSRGSSEDLTRGVSQDARGSKLHIEPDRRIAIQEAVSAAKNQDVIVVAGKGHESYQIIGTTKFPFDDASVLRAAAAAR